MSITSEISRIQSAKSTLKTKLNAKNDEQHQIVNETLDEYGDFVDSISTGTDTSDATASASDILTGKTAYISTGKTNGSMVNNGILSYTPSTSSQSIPTGYTLGGTIGAVTSSIDNNIIPENIKKDVTILDVTGTLETITPSCSATLTQITGHQHQNYDYTRDDLKVYYKGSMTDKTTNNINGSFTGSYSISNEIITFSGGYATTGDINSARGSWELYCKVNSNFTPRNSNDWYNCSCIMGCEIGGTGQDFGIIIDKNGYYAIGWNTANVTSTNVIANDGQYHHLVINTSDTNLILYIDGVEEANVTYSMSGSIPEQYGIFWNKSSGDTKVLGEVKTFRYYTSQLTEFQINQNYNYEIGSIPVIYSFEEDLDYVLEEKTNKILPENIKNGITILGVRGIYGDELYTELEYIEGTGTQYIDLEFKPTSTSVVEVSFCNPSVHNWEQVFGTRIDKEFGFRQNGSTSNSYRFGLNNATTNVSVDASTTFVKAKLSGDGKYYINDIQQGTLSATATGNNNLMIFKGNGEVGILKIKYVKVWENNTLLMDLIPVKDLCSNACLFNKINEKFYYNSGSGRFIAGPVKTNYTELEYIQSTGTQYINTGVAAARDVEFEMKLNVTEATSQYCEVIGGGDSWDAQNALGVMWRRNDNSYNKQFQFKNEYPSSTFTHDYINIDTILSFKNLILKLDTGTYSDTMYPSNVSTFTGSNIKLFCGSYSNDNPTMFVDSMKLYYCKIWKDDTLIRDFIPVKDTNNVVCLYDKVSKEFYYNSGTGDFIAGSVVN